MNFVTYAAIKDLLVRQFAALNKLVAIRCLCTSRTVWPRAGAGRWAVVRTCGGTYFDGSHSRFDGIAIGLHDSDVVEATMHRGNRHADEIVARSDQRVRVIRKRRARALVDSLSTPVDTHGL